jgi:hypothetical protein
MGLIAADESDSVVLYSEGAMFFRFKTPLEQLISANL